MIVARMYAHHVELRSGSCQGQSRNRWPPWPPVPTALFLWLILKTMWPPAGPIRPLVGGHPDLDPLQRLTHLTQERAHLAARRQRLCGVLSATNGVCIAGLSATPVSRAMHMAPSPAGASGPLTRSP